MKKCMIMFLICLIPISVSAANTVTLSRNIITITDIDSDFTWANYVSDGKAMRISSIQFHGAADEVCILKSGSDAGPIFFKATIESVYYPQYMPLNGIGLKPYLDFSAGSYGATSMVIFILGTN